MWAYSFKLLIYIDANFKHLWQNLKILTWEHYAEFPISQFSKLEGQNQKPKEKQYEPVHEKTNNLHMRKQRRRPASR